MNNILQMASERVAAEKLLYMEVTEEGNPRTSFDLNVYKAGIPVRVCAPILMEACRHYRLPEGEFRALLEKIGRKPLGHLSGGIGRDGKDFLTIYYGMEGR